MICTGNSWYWSFFLKRVFGNEILSFIYLMTHQMLPRKRFLSHSKNLIHDRVLEIFVKPKHTSSFKPTATCHRCLKVLQLNFFSHLVRLSTVSVSNFLFFLHFLIGEGHTWITLYPRYVSLWAVKRRDASGGREMQFKKWGEASQDIKEARLKRMRDYRWALYRWPQSSTIATWFALLRQCHDNDTNFLSPQ